MTSSMMTGEQRWASKRRGGMTVLGKVAKVAVPKPLNLPSQRLENQGLDPTVEIVPKGTLSWGSRPSSASSNAWATSAPSPSTDGGSSSPSHLPGRPLSGSGTRPLTAGSEKAHDSNVSSRPSSASGVLGSNHASLSSLRPRSADTRPGSSHLSRFAEPSPEGSRAWGATASSERMGASEGFSLTSGDFPTLGSEKDESRRNLEPLDSSHERPGSSSGGVKSISDSMEITHDDARDSDIKGHSWRKDCLPFVEDGPRPSMDRWHGDPHLFQNPNIGLAHYDNWRGAPPVNPQGGVWYRGPPGHPPYGGPIPPGPPPYGSPFPYYRPQVPAPVLANSQSIPPPGTGHHGHHPKNGDMYRPHMPESFMHHGGPMRPGFYPPHVPYEGYYRSPMGFCNPNDRDFPFMGMNSGPPIYNRPMNQNLPDLNSSHGRGPDEIDPGLLHHPRVNHNVSVNPNDGWNRNGEEKWGRRVSTDGSNHEKGILSKVILQENALGDDYKPSNRIDYGESRAKDDVPSRPRYSKFSGSISNVEEPGRGLATDDLVSSTDHSLIQKIQGLNAKARTSGGSQGAFHREERIEKLQVDNVRAHQSAVDEGETRVILERHIPTGVIVPVSCDTDVASEKNGESVRSTVPRRAIHGVQNRGNCHVKGSFDGQDSYGWGRNSQSHSVRSTSSNLIAIDQVENHNSAVQPSEVRAANIEMKGDGESAMFGFDRTDTQRAKMRELAKQRAIQLQKEEEERIREQKAKALAKLEELNRRSATQSAEVSSQKEIVPPQSTAPVKPDNSVDQPDSEPKSNAGSSSVISNKAVLIDENGANKVQSPTDDTHFEDAAGNRTAPQVCDVAKNKRAGYKLNQGVPPEKNLSQMSIIIGQIDVLKDHKVESVNQVQVTSKGDEGVGKELSETPLVSDLPALHKRRNNKSGKNKHKTEDSSIAVSSTVSSNNSDLGQAVSASVNDNASDPHANSTIQGEDRVNNSWKGQHSRKPRSSHGNRLSEKAQSNDAVVWAPVRLHNKVENTDRTNQKASEPFVPLVIGENRPQSSSKTKRAEMERYVPKPVAKELSQQGSTQQPPSVSVDHSPTAQASQDSSSGIGGRGKASQGSDSGACSVMKDQLPSVRGKSQTFKGKKGSSSNCQSFDPKVSNAGLMDSHCDTQINHREKTLPLKENKAAMDRSVPHWQPKSQPYVAHNQQGNNHMAQDNKGLKPDIGSGSGAHSHSQYSQSATKDSRLGSEDKAMADMGHQETKREKRGPHLKGRTHTPSQEKNSVSQGVEGEIEPVSSEGADRRTEQRPSLGYRKNSNYGGRFNRVHEPRGDWSTMAPESRQHYSSANPTERQRRNSHYEYQPVGPYNSNDSGPQIENQHGGSKFRERGHSRRGRGNFHGRPNGNNE